MSQASLLLLNIGATLARMALTVSMGLWTTRLAYQSLGADGFGAWAAVTGVVAFISLLGDALASSAQRRLAYDVGAGELDEVRRTAGNVATLLGLIAAAVAVGIVGLAPWLAAPLVAPPEVKQHLVEALRWVGLGAALTLAEAPFRSYLTARQSIVLLSVFDLFEASARLFAAWLLACAAPGLAAATVSDYTRLVFFSVGASNVALAAYCLVAFPETRPGPLRGVGELLKFAAWMLVGFGGWKLRTEGVQVLMNLIAGAAATASYGVCKQLAMYQNSVSYAIYRAIRPATIAAHGRQAGDAVRRLSLGASKAIGLANLLITVPLVFETPTLLRLWLGEAPDSMVAMVRALVAWISLRDLTIGHEMAVHGRGRVGLHESLGLGLDVLGLALGSLAVWSGAPTWTLVGGVFLSVLGQTVVRVFGYGDAAHATARQWGREVLGRWLMVMVAGATAAGVVTLLMAPTPARVPWLAAAAWVATLGAIATVGLDPSERQRVVAAFAALRRRFR